VKRGGPLKRTKGINRGASQLKRTRINPISKKRAKLNREVNPKRRAYVQEMGRCAVFPDLQATECHEMAGGSDREKALKEPACWLAVSREGHDIVQYESKAKQLARKLTVDPRRFSLTAFNSVYTGKESPVLLESVATHLTMA
jgi:hypothetical protein